MSNVVTQEQCMERERELTKKIGEILVAIAVLQTIVLEDKKKTDRKEKLLWSGICSLLGVLVTIVANYLLKIKT